jgi:hypothetical protein
MISLFRGLWPRLSPNAFIRSSLFAIALCWCDVNDAEAQSALHDGILNELRSAHAEVASVATSEPDGAAKSATEAYSTIFPLCNSERVSDYYRTFGRLHGLDGQVNIDALAQQIYDERSLHGYWQESRWPASEAVGYDVVSRAAMDWAFGEWLSRHYLGVQSSIEFSQTLSVALVLRAWCRVRLQNTRMLSQFITHHGFPSASLFSAQIESTALFIFKHSDTDPQLVAQFARAATRAHARHQYSDSSYAYLLDTLAVFRNQPQPIGSYYNCDGTQAVYDPPLKDRRRAEVLRRRYGLRSIEEDLSSTSQQLCAAAP